MLSLIAAVGENFELGKDNDLIWHLSPDMKFFRTTTKDHNVIMGRKTFESLGGLLPNRHHVVLTSNPEFSYDGVEVFHSVEDVLGKYRDVDEECFVIGGGEVYKLFLPYADKLYLTHVKASCSDADTYFPKFDKNDYDSGVLLQFTDEKTGISAEIVEYIKK